MNRFNAPFVARACVVHPTTLVPLTGVGKRE
jgi:hypothetical protein